MKNMEKFKEWRGNRRLKKLAQLITCTVVLYDKRGTILRAGCLAGYLVLDINGPKSNGLIGGQCSI